MAWGEARRTEPETAEEQRWWRLGAEAEAAARKHRHRALAVVADTLAALDATEDDPARALDMFRFIYYPTRLERVRHAVGWRWRRFRAR